MSKEQTALVKASEYHLFSSDVSELDKTFAVNLGGDQINASDLDRVKVPSGGALSFEIPDVNEPDGVSTSKTIEGVIVAHKSVRAYWSKSLDEGDGSQPPDCYSDDAVSGIGEPGGKCNPH